jgi:hypothetical protein
MNRIISSVFTASALIFGVFLPRDRPAQAWRRPEVNFLRLRVDALPACRVYTQKVTLPERFGLALFERSRYAESERLRLTVRLAFVRNTILHFH